MALLTLTDARNTLGNIPADRNAELQQYIDAATAVIEDIVGPIDAATFTETFDGGGSALFLRNANVTVTSVTIDGTAATATTGYRVDAENGIVYTGTETDWGRFATGSRNIVVVYTSAISPVPANVKLAAQEELRFLWQLSQQGNRPAFGDAPEADEFTPSGFAVPHRVIELCGRRLRRPRAIPNA